MNHAGDVFVALFAEQHEAAGLVDAARGHQRPKIEEYGASLFTVLHLVEPVPGNLKELSVGEVNVFTGRNYVLPRVGQEGIPLVSVNTAKVDVEISRIGDRNLICTCDSVESYAS